MLSLAGTLTACSGSGDSDSGGTSSVNRQNAAAPAAPSSARAGEKGQDTGERKRNTPNAPLAAAREVVHTATLRVRADDVEAAAAKAKQLVTAAGGYVEKESTSSDHGCCGSSTGRSGDRSEIALKIPATRYPDVLNALGTQLGTKLSLTQEADDVTGEVADVAARVRSAQATLASFRKLLDKATSVSEIISIENEIAEREADLEALQAREKTLRNSTAFATVTVTLVSKAPPPVKKDDERGGFVGALGDGWHAFTAFLGGLAVLLGWLLPFLVTIAVLGVPVLVFRRRLRVAFEATTGRWTGRVKRPQNPPPTG
ncbi:DUF4349 domain-containing protein [Actinomadura meridiana]|uniref:DUF4349 domain-containing protein n=1 Tax=Actinomadura meridiana TaxID=559626 RepID=A0ABP8CQN0_9ACTN